MTRAFTYRNKYRIAGALLKDARGSLLDVGARDAVLRTVIDPAALRYRSADVGGNCDFTIDLERPLSFRDCEFDYVVALDVLEHVENIHAAFHELARIARVGLIIALPNMAALRSRLHFLARGQLPTRKYDLAVIHPGDRHRWLTVHSQIHTFMSAIASECGFEIVELHEEADGTGPLRVVSWALASIGLGRSGLWTGRCVYSLCRRVPL